MNDFIYDIPTKVFFGNNYMTNVGRETAKIGKNVLLVYGGGSIKKSGLYDNIIAQIKAENLSLFELGGVEPNPRHTTVNKGAKMCRQHNIDVILAVGGGSVIDCAKVIGTASYYDGDSWDLVTHKVKGERCLPVVTVLTLSATGSEMNFSAVISNMDTNDKIGYKFPPMRPKVSFLDPTLTFSVDKYQTACGSADILSHIFEVYFNMDENSFLMDTFMEGMMKTIIKYTPIALKEPNNYEARANIMWASSWAINGLIYGGNTQLWSCHAIEHQLSAYYDITHGLGLAIITPKWMEHVLDGRTVTKFYQFGTNVFGIDKNLPQQTVAKLAIDALKTFLYIDCNLPSNLTAVGIGSKHIKVMAEKAVTLGSLQNTFKPLSCADVESILQNSL